MKIVDANVLLHAANRSSAHHEVASNWLRQHLTGAETVGFTWIVMLAFLRISTHPSIFPRPLTATQAHNLLDGWLDQPSSSVVEPGAQHLTRLGILLGEHGGANLVNDAHLAAIALDRGGSVVTFDGDFRRFAGLKVEYPS